MDAGNQADDGLNELYREVILEHHRHPRGRRRIEAPSVEVVRQNPTCGDQVTVQLEGSPGDLAAVAVQVRGCALSVASGSLMAEAVTGRDAATARRLGVALAALLDGAEDEATRAELGPLAALSGVRRFPVRHRCVLLPWEALEAALAELEGK